MEVENSMDTSRIDLLSLAGRYTKLKKVAGTGGGEWHGPCPMCGGEDRFQVQPNNKRWACRQCSPRWQDAIELVKAVEGVDFKAACERLGLTLESNGVSHSNPTVRNSRTVQPSNILALNPTYTALTDRAWQRYAHDFVWDSTECLWTDCGAKALQYLLDRGLTRPVISDAYLGYNDHERRLEWGETEVWLPRGITIPWHFERHYWRVNIRRPAGEPKYIGPAGAANGLYQAHRIKPYSIVVMVEGEFDALVLRSQAPDLCQRGFVPVATGTASWARVLRWVSMVSMASFVLLAFDTDDAGDSAAAWWGSQLGSKSYRLKPLAHDITDMWKAGHSISNWMMTGLDNSLELAA